MMDQLDHWINTSDPNDPLILDRWPQWINTLDPTDPLIQSHDTFLAGCALHTVKSFAPWSADLSTRLVTKEKKENENRLRESNLRFFSMF